MADAISIGLTIDDTDAKKAFKSLESSALKIAGILLGGFTFKKMIDAATESEDAINKLNIALQMQGKYTQEASQSFIDYAANIQATTGYSDDLVISSASLLVSIGKLSGQGLERATDAALDLAAATGKDLNTTMELLAKAAAGNTGALSRYGIIIDESVPKSLRFAEALKQIQNQMGGMAEGRLNTFSGSLLRLQNSFSDILEEMGKLFTQSPVLKTFINLIAAEFDRGAKAIEKFGKSGDVVKDYLIQPLLDIAKVITQYVMPPFEFLFNAISGALYMIAGAIQEFLIIPLTAAGNLVGKVGNVLGVISDETASTLEVMNQSAVGALADLNAKTTESLNGLFNFDATLAADNVVMGLQQVVDQVKPSVDAARNSINPFVSDSNGLTVAEGFTATLDGMKTAMQEFAMESEKNFKRVGAAMFQSLGSGAGQAFAAFGKAIAKGENAIQAFLNTLIASMGQMAIQLGTQFILQGIAYMWAGLPNGPSLISAGAALAAFGGILSAVGGGGGESSGSSSASAGGGSSNMSMSPSGSEGIDTLEEQKPQTNITVQVQGNILDRRQTGLELAEVIQETFGSNGINYNTA